MAVLNILQYPDSRLRIHAEEVTEVTPEIRTLIDDMIDTINAEKARGLAATQVNVHKRVIVIRSDIDPSVVTGYINPVFTPLVCEKQNSFEGCLSVPLLEEELNNQIPVPRYPRVNLKALDRNGEPVDMDMEGMDAICLQHEVDHLNGIVYVDYASAEVQRQVQDIATAPHPETAAA